VLKEYDLYVVADGMGGHRAGDVASKIATETISEFFRTTANDDVTWPFHFDTNLSEEENRLLTGIRVANRQIFERSTRSREYHGMGTTVVGAMFSPRKRRMYIGHVGDSRCYRVRDGIIQLLTRDHSLINDYLLAMPDLTEEQKSELPKNVITRALGMQDQVVVDLQHDDPHPNDVYVLCSDGLSGMVTDEEIQKIVATGADIRDACRKLIQRANERGGEDNITAILIKIEETADTEIIGAQSTDPPRAVVPEPDLGEEPTMPGVVPEVPARTTPAAPAVTRTPSPKPGPVAPAAPAAPAAAAPAAPPTPVNPAIAATPVAGTPIADASKSEPPPKADPLATTDPAKPDPSKKD
jgi:protein phosphatase